MVFGVMVVVAKVSRTTVVAPILPIWTLSKILDISLREYTNLVTLTHLYPG